MAFRTGRWRNLMLVLVVAPFFTSSSSAPWPGRSFWPYPVAAALSITVMVSVLVLVLSYVRKVGARELL